MRWTIFLILGLIVGACTTLEIGVEKPSSPDEDAIATLANLMFQGTQYAQILSEQRGTPEPNLLLLETGVASGKICYPGSLSPAMSLFFRKLSDDELFEFAIDEYQEEFNINLPNGSYYAFAWVPQYLVGGLYSEKVICGDNPECSDHSPAIISVEAGESIKNIDICDWGFTQENLPLPPGTAHLDADLYLKPIE